MQVVLSIGKPQTISEEISSVQSLNRVQLFATPWTAAHQAPSPSSVPEACSNSCPSSQWCHPAISSSVVPSEGMGGGFLLPTPSLPLAAFQAWSKWVGRVRHSWNYRKWVGGERMLEGASLWSLQLCHEDSGWKDITGKTYYYYSFLNGECVPLGEHHKCSILRPWGQEDGKTVGRNPPISEKPTASG